MYNYVLCVNGGVAEAAPEDSNADTATTGEPDLTAAAATLGITEQELIGAHLNS